MLSTHRDSKSLSCDSLFYERSSLKRKLPSGVPPGTSNISFKNDDYNYLINCNELIKTCKEALLENETSVITAITDITAADSVYSDSHEEDFIKVPQTQELEKNSFAEFVKWLSYTEHQLETICYCANNKILADLPDIISHHKAIQSEIENVGRRFVNDIKGNASVNVSATKNTLNKEERRWHSLWLRSLEYLMILEEGPHCPQHYNIGVEEHLMPTKRHKNNVGIASNTSRIRNKRVQTTVAMVGQSTNEMYNNNNNNFNNGGKYEIIQKDIGYSSDADMSDAVEAHPHSDQATLSSRSVRKRHVRKRRSRAPRSRPWSFHSDWTDWDYYQTPLNYNGDYNSSENLFGYDDDKTIRNLIEFGENYESWISNDDDDLIRVSTPLLSSDANKKAEPFETPAEIKEAHSHPYAHKQTKSSSMQFTFTILIYVTLAIFALAVTISHYSPHIQKIYPHRPPPI